MEERGTPDPSRRPPPIHPPRGRYSVLHAGWCILFSTRYRTCVLIRAASMGHTIIARLPRTARWQAVVDLLAMPELRAADVAGLTSRAARSRLLGLHTDPSLTYCFW